MIRRAVAMAGIAGSLMLGGCGGLLPTPDLTNPSPIGGGPQIDNFGSTIDVANSTDLAVTIVVNGTATAVIRPHSAAIVNAGLLPPKPWSVEARTPSGRLLVSFVVEPGQVHRDATTMNGAGGRADLQCGRLDVTVGAPMMGPPPDPSHLADCSP